MNDFLSVFETRRATGLGHWSVDRLTRFATAAATAAALLGAACLPASAQTDAPCPILSDAALSDALGAPAHAQDALSSPPLVSCVLAASGVEIWLSRGPVPPEMAGMASASNAAGGQWQQSMANSLGVNATQISGLGDSALLVSDPSDKDNPSATLWVFSGSDAYTLTSWGLSDPQTCLPAVARAAMANH
jgi:hypothetical protein